ncbi:MAG TPA: hypothetical protein VGS22_19530 [Thermoanaerobaculia bacterium]|nr:hypothetical protein [Thermoanaerobaculia bacterium]
MNKAKKKLSLHRETVRRLADRDLRHALGGITRVPTCNTLDNNCTEIAQCNVESIPPRNC